MVPEHAARMQRLVEAAGRTRPVTLAHERLLPVAPALAAILPDGGLRRGTTVGVSGSTSLALALVAQASTSGSWCAAVGAPAVGLVAADELGVALERFPLIAASGRSWVRAVAAAFEGFDLVLGWPPAGQGRQGTGIAAAEARRLAALVRERGAVLVACGPGWPDRTDLRLEVVRSDWFGLDQGRGRLRARRLEIAVGGRGAASAGRMASLWLPAADGGIVLEGAAASAIRDVAAVQGATG
jgi:hypothetical protein